MKKLLTVLLCSLLISPFLQAGECEDLMAKYKAPDPGAKTMKQVKRWVKRKLKGSPDAGKMEECLIAGAADNPNKANMAGK